MSAASISSKLLVLIAATLALLAASAVSSIEGTAHAGGSDRIEVLKSGGLSTSKAWSNASKHRCKITGRTRKARAKSRLRCARTRTSRRQDSARGPQFLTDPEADGRGADAAGTQGAIDWALAQQGRTDYYWWCLKFAAHAFNRPYAGYNSPVEMVAARGVNGGEPPVGALVMFGAVPGNPYGHVGIYLGGGKMINALKTVRISPISQIPNYRGWQHAPQIWGGRAPSNPAPQFVAAGHTPAGGAAAPSTPPAPSAPSCSSAGGTSAGGPGARGFTVSDVYLGGTWARTDTCNGTWYSKGNRPANAAWWYPNGLGLGVDCARTGAAYTVKWASGRVETWSTWFHVTDGKWFPSAAANETANNSFYGLPAC